MERVSTLLKKLQQQLDQNAPASSMLQTVQLLESELMSKLVKNGIQTNERVAIIMPQTFRIPAQNEETAEEEEKVVEVLQVNEKDVEEELDQIKKKAEVVNSATSHARPTYNFDPIEDVPTLSHQNYPLERSFKNELPFEYPESLNDRLKETKIELSQSLTTSPIKDLKKAIGVNDRFLFINELFRGDEAMYERSIKTIQNFSIFAEAEFWIRRELKLKLGWKDSDPVVKQFDQLVKRRFS